MISRRRLLVLATGGPAAPGLAAAQERGRLRRVGLLMASAENDPDGQERAAAFHDALRALGWVEGTNLRFDLRWASGSVPLFRAHAAELVALEPDLLLADGTPAVAALLAVTRGLPIVFCRVGDPVGSRFVDSFARPGGNATGFTAFDPLMGPKWLELLKEAASRLRHIALLYNPDTAPHVETLFLPATEAGAATLGTAAVPAPVRSPDGIEAALERLSAVPGSGLVAMPDTFLVDHRAQIIGLAARHGVPAIYTNRLFAAEGGLMSYGFRVLDAYRQAATYADRLLRGARVADLPVQAPSGFQLMLNLRTAQALGLAIPATLLARADEVIE